MAKNYNPVEVERRRQKNRNQKKSKQLRNTQKHEYMTNKDYDGILKHMKQLDENEAKKRMPPKACEDKRKKLKQQYLEIIKFYRKTDNKQKIMELESKLRIYENERDFQMSVYLAEATAENPSDIPLPPGPEIPSALLINPPSMCLNIDKTSDDIPGPPLGPIPNLIEVSKRLRKVFRYDDTGGSYQSGNFSREKNQSTSNQGPSLSNTNSDKNAEQKATVREFRKFDPSSEVTIPTAQISSAPVKRNMIKEATRIVPAHLLVRRDVTKQNKKNSNISTGTDFAITSSFTNQFNETKKTSDEGEDSSIKKGGNMDEAYDLFMKQIDDLI
ncbi:WW domain binding protein 11 family-containing protein [Strongyloides ratti]|uniref:WW domain binding protein 11 family-containing protein n=1 Tax=Strongyloides ratti TaxID=34506 RepID=A0A090L7U7_STRRB|nr:WW domain binding protein 11 family-containing protein [Strongyloides ratti]CEF65876.1 WW domain binding protein 11 family-containing protein [Strongyloides ratti]